MTGHRFNAREASIVSTVMGEADAGSSGSTKTVACLQRSVLELGTAVPGQATGPCPQAKQEAAVGEQLSDGPIVVGDGRADHMAKGSAGLQRMQRTYAGTRNSPKLCVSSYLQAMSGTANAISIARNPDEPGAVIPHAGISEGVAR